MIRSLVLLNIDKFITNKIWFVSIVFSLFSFHYKKIAYSLNLSFWEFFINVMTDQYYILYFMIIFLSFLFLV